MRANPERLHRGPILAAALALLVSCHPSAGPVAGALDDLADGVDALAADLDAHATAVAAASDAEEVARAEEAHGQAVREGVDRAFGAVQSLELCLREGEARQTPWLARELGEMGAEAERHRGAASDARDHEEALREEARHQAAMKEHLAALGAYQGRARQGAVRAGRAWECPVSGAPR